MIHNPTEMNKNTTLDCDVCVVGSGAGGAVVAKELAESGLKVVLLEEGGFFDTKDYLPNDPAESLIDLYRNAGASVIFGNPNILFAEGRCVGGSTVINGGVCWRTPERIMKRWQWEKGMRDFTPKKMEPYFSRVESMIHVGPTLPESRNQDSLLLKQGCESLGYTVKENTRSQNRCVGTNLCVTGCPTGAKQSVVSSYIPLFLKNGGEIFTHCRVHKLITKRRRVLGVEGVIRDPVTKRKRCRLRVRSKVVVSSGGAIQTPALLLKSGIRDEGRFLGRNFIVHPNVKVMAVFENPVQAWNGVNNGFQVTEFMDEGIIMGVNFVPPALLALGMPVKGIDVIRILKEEFHHMVLGGGLIEDTGNGRILVGPFDTIVPEYKLGAIDVSKAIRAIALLSEIFFAAGAKKCYLPLPGLYEIRSIDEIPKIYQLKLKASDLELLTVHIMGTAQMGSDAHSSVINPHGEMHNVKGLFVADASVFPTSIGVNPQVSIMAIASRTADYIANNFSRYH